MKFPDVGSTSGPALAPDLGPGAGQARDAALDEQSREGMATALPDHEPPPATADVDAAIESGRARMTAERALARMMTGPVLSALRLVCATCGGSGWVPSSAGTGVLGYSLCPGCGGTTSGPKRNEQRR